MARNNNTNTESTPPPPSGTLVSNTDRLKRAARMRPARFFVRLDGGVEIEIKKSTFDDLLTRAVLSAWVVIGDDETVIYVLRAMEATAGAAEAE